MCTCVGTMKGEKLNKPQSDPNLFHFFFFLKVWTWPECTQRVGGPVQSQWAGRLLHKHTVKPDTNVLKGSDPHLYVNLVVSGSVYRTVEAEPNHEYPSVYWEPEKKNRTGILWRNVWSCMYNMWCYWTVFSLVAQAKPVCPFAGLILYSIVRLWSH